MTDTTPTQADVDAQRDLTNANRVFEQRVNSAARSLAGFAGGLLSTNPQLATVANNFGALGKVVGYLADQFTVLRGLSNYAVTFGNDMNLMSTSVAGARMQLGDFQKLVAENTNVFSTFNNSINGGAQEFLRMQRQFYFVRDEFGNFTNQATQAATYLERLGYDTNQINETFLAFDAITNYRRRTERMTIDERNAAAAAFTKELTIMARLTGQRADEMAANMAALSREGDIAAFLPDLAQQMRIPFTQSLEVLKGMSPELQELGRDILIRGRPLEDMREVVSMLPQTTNLLYQARRALLDEDLPTYNRLMEEAMVAAAHESQSRTNRFLAQQSSTNAYTQKAFRVVGGLSSGLAEQLRQILDENPGMQFGQAMRIARERVQREADAQTRDLPPDANDPRRVTDAMITMQQSLSAMAVSAQEQLRGVYTQLSASAAQFTTFINDQASNLINGPLNVFGDAVALFTGRVSDNPEEREAAIMAAINNLNRAGRTDLANELTRLRESVYGPGVAPETRQQSDIDRINELMRQALTASTFDVEHANIPINGSATFNIPAGVPFIPPGQNNPANGSGGSIGTLGQFNSLFRDFGPETLFPLHNVEAVLTPRQMGEVVENSAMGMARAIATSFNDLQRRGPAIGQPITIRTDVSALSGALNTLRTSIRQSTGTSGQITPEMISDLMSRGFNERDLNRAFEAALNGSLRPALDSLLAVQTEHARTSDRIRKSFRGISNDYMRT